MKYLYLLFRLFKCPHKYHKFESFNKTSKFTGEVVQITIVMKCSRCGKLHVEEIQ